ncbi:hypothetical protein BJF78_36395 [Pseudonocardia sp. CNS-139]|nr:hypothetical protein BJF78_36395 [Pseudonocardia sp. CNS-139]
MMTSQNTQPDRDAGSGKDWFYVLMKTETGHDAIEYVQAESEFDATVIAANLRDDVAVVIDAFPTVSPSELPALELDPIDGEPEHDADASVACARAVAATAAAVARARAAGDEHAVGVVVVEDVEAACDEDGGF